MAIKVVKKKKRGEGKHPKPKSKKHPSKMTSLTPELAATHKEKIAMLNKYRGEMAKMGTKKGVGKKSTRAKKKMKHQREPVYPESLFDKEKWKKKKKKKTKTLLYRGRSVLNKDPSRGI